MNSNRKRTFAELFETISLKIQELHRDGKITDEQALLKIDYRNEAVNAPFIFDTVNGRLHHAACKKIPYNSKTALYSVWQLQDKDLELSCKECHPVPVKKGDMKKVSTSDIVYGFISVMDQFGSVLLERGKEYRRSERGQKVTKSIDALFKELDHKQREVLNIVLSSMDGVLKTMQELNANLEQTGNNENGAPPKRNTPPGRRKNGRKVK